MGSLLRTSDHVSRFGVVVQILFLCGAICYFFVCSCTVSFVCVRVLVSLTTLVVLICLIKMILHNAST